MYYRKIFCNHFVENNFKLYLRDPKQDTLKKNSKIEFSGKPNKKCFNSCQKSSRAFVFTKPEEKSNLKEKYQYTIENLKTSIEMFNTNTKKTPKSKNTNNNFDSDFGKQFNETFTNPGEKNTKPKSLKANLNNSINFSLTRNKENKPRLGRTPSNAKKLKFFYGNNPIEVLTEKKQNEILEKEKVKLAQRSKQVEAILDSSKMKISMENYNKPSHVKHLSYNKINKITLTPKNLIESMFSKEKSHNRKKNVVGFDDKNKKFFYMG